jgi:DNA adenine methylase
MRLGEDMPVKAIAPWFGGKRNLADWIVATAGPHNVWWELGCGSMAVTLAKPVARMETLVDLHGDLINLARVICDTRLGPELYRRLARTMMCDAIFADSDAFLRAHESRDGDVPLSVERAYHYFVSSWMGRNGNAGMPANRSGTYCVRFTGSGGHAATRWRSAIASMPAWRKRLSKCTLMRSDLFDVLGRIDDLSGTAIYVDPPYLRKSTDYLHDFTGEDHQRLAIAADRFRNARIVISYYAHPDLDVLYPGWTKLTRDVPKSLSHQVGRGANDARATEVLLVNQRVEAEGLFG